VRPLVVHAPSNRDVKGSEFIVRAVEILKEENRDFDFVLIENMPNSEALDHYRRADIIIDQLMIGWYGVLAMEGMALGKAVVAYISPDLIGHFGGRMPLLNANPDTITSVLRDAVGDAEMRREFGRRGRAFVEEVHDSCAVARAAVQMYEDILHTPTSPAVPNFAPVLGHSLQIRQWYDDIVFKKAPAAEEETEIGQLRSAAARYEQLRTELHSLRYASEKYEELKSELPALRYKAKRYDEIKEQLPNWKAKAERLDRLTTSPLGKFALPLLGVSRGAGRKGQDGEPTVADAADGE
jgi:hypothetical protein